MLIHFVHQGDAYLPELPAYAEFLRAAGHQAALHRRLDTLPTDAEVLWWMCGRVEHTLAQRHPRAFHIHEYASASVPPFAWLKDRVKRWRQARPQYRIFQNEWVRQRMGFGDATPFEFRDMGISPAFFDASQPPTTEFDFVYLGEMRRLSHFLPVFEALDRASCRVLLIGEVPDELWPQLRRYPRLTATGRVRHEEVPALLRRARFGLNLVPDQLPYTRQTSTKLLEYCAAGLRVVSTDYAWVRDFERSHAACFAYLPGQGTATTHLSSLHKAMDEAEQLVVPDLRSLTWPRLLAGLRIWQQLGIGA